jgi:hypothetical protein
MDDLEETGRIEARWEEIANAVAGDIRFSEENNTIETKQDARIKRLKQQFNLGDVELIQIFLQIEMVMQERGND